MNVYMTMGPLPSMSESLSGLLPGPASVKSGAFCPTSSAAAGHARPSTTTSPAISANRLRMTPSWSMGSLLGNGLGRLLHERRVHDPLEGNRALHESVVRPPLHLPLDVRHEQASVAVLIGEAEPDHLGLGLRVLRRDAHHVVVVGAGGGTAVLLDEDGVIVAARGLDVALHEGDGALPVRRELLGEEHGHRPPRMKISRPEEDLAETLGLRGAREGLGQQDGVDLLALEGLDGRRHRLERDHADVGQLEAGLLEDVAQRVVKGGAEGGDADTLALEVGDRAEAAVVELLLDHDARERIAGPLASLVGDQPDLLPAQDDVVQRGGDASGAHVDLPRGQRGSNRGSRLEEHQLRLDAELLEEALVHPDEQRRRGGELEGTDLHRPVGVRGRHDEADGEQAPRQRHYSAPRAAHAVWRQGTASRSPLVSTQCERTPRAERQTMPTMSLVVSMMFPAWSTRKPMPESAAIISAATRRRSAVPAPSLSPAKIMGRAEGRITLRMTLPRPAPKATAARTRSGSASRTPA